MMKKILIVIMLIVGSFSFSYADDRVTSTYFILDTCSGDIKIGKSVDINRRFKQFQTGNIHIELIGYVSSDIEKRLHRRFKADNVRLEWFDLDIDDLVDIEGIKFINVNK